MDHFEQIEPGDTIIEHRYFQTHSPFPQPILDEAQNQTKMAHGDT